jgi:hypothetical protein
MSLEIIVKKLSNHLDIPKTDLTFGNVRSQMASDLLKSLTTVIDKKSDYTGTYYILVHTKIDPADPSGKTIKEKLILLDRIPSERYIGTILVKVDNKNADAEILWNLPLDTVSPILLGAPEPGDRRESHGVARIIDSAKGLPIFNRRVQ